MEPLWLLKQFATHPSLPSAATLESIGSYLKPYIPRDVNTLLVYLGILYLSMQILNMAFRYVYNMVVMVIRLVLVIFAVGLGLWVYRVGAAEALRQGEGVLMHGGGLVESAVGMGRERFEEWNGGSGAGKAGF